MAAVSDYNCEKFYQDISQMEKDTTANGTHYWWTLLRQTQTEEEKRQKTTELVSYGIFIYCY
jgi:hypothetical protein